LKLLLDTQVLLWVAEDSDRLSAAVRNEITDPANELVFSAASFWEISIENALGREDFRVDSRQLRQGLLDNGYVELPITSKHAVSIDQLPPLHKIHSIESYSHKRLLRASRSLPPMRN